VVERSEPGCGLPPALNFKYVHHPRWGGRRAELGSCLPHGLVTRFFLQHLDEKDVHQPCGGGELWLRRGRAAAGAVSCRVSGSLAWMALVPPPAPPPAAKRGAAVRPPHGRWLHRAQVCRICGVPYAAGHTALMPPRGSYNTSYAMEVGSRVLGWSFPHPRRRMGARTFLHALRRPPSPVSHRCRGGRCRRC
jgi:hypothetical protein